MKIWKITAVLCCLIMAFSLVGCKRSAQPVDTIDVSEGEVPYTGGTHVFNIKKTNRNIVENGKSEYKIGRSRGRGKRNNRGGGRD